MGVDGVGYGEREGERERERERERELVYKRCVWRERERIEIKF